MHRLELKSSDLQNYRESLRGDVTRGLSRGVKDIPPDEQYFGWIVATRDFKDSLRPRIKQLLRDIGEIAEYSVSDAIPVNDRCLLRAPL
jgi:hypothetical protein